MLEKKFANTFGIFSVSKILYVCRLFNGLEQSVIEGKWSPTGVPTIFRMIEKLKSGQTVFMWDKFTKDFNIPQRKEKDLNDLVKWEYENRTECLKDLDKYFTKDSLDIIFI